MRTQDFAGPIVSRGSRVSGPISRHRVADILPHMKMFRVLPVLDCLLVLFASYVMGFVLHGDFTLLNLITPVELDAQMNLTLSLITMSVPGCFNIFISFWRCYDTATKKPFIARLDRSGLLPKLSIWNCGTGVRICC